MKQFVVLSDLHAHPWSAFSTGDGAHNSRLVRSLEILDKSLEHANNLHVPWVFAGDLVHTAGYALNTVMSRVTDILCSYPRVTKVMVWGNHDARGVGGKITLEQTCLAALEYAVDDLWILDPSLDNDGLCEWFSAKDAGDDIVFAGAGYQPRASMVGLVGAPQQQIDVGIYHQTVRGSQAANGFQFDEGLDPAQLHSYYKISIVGHIHHPQSIGKFNILVPGSPEHHNFGDKGDHGWWIVELPDDGSSPRLEFFDGGSPRFLTVDTPADVKDDGNFYRIRTVAAGEAVPEGVLVIGPEPTVVEARDTLRGISEVDQVLQLWLKNNPPDAEEEDYLATGRELLSTQEPTRLRDIQLSELRLHNFCCFRDESISLDPGLWLITGCGRDYPSNGAGKSTLIGEALYWLLFGRTTKGLGANEVIRYNTTECNVSAIFRENGRRLLVERKRSAAGASELVVLQDPTDRTPVEDAYFNFDRWEASSVTEMTAKLNRYLGITPEIFQNLSYFSQEKLVLFSSATDGERKDVLSDLIGLSAYQNASSGAASEAAKHELKSNEQQIRAEVLQAQVERQNEDILGHKERVDAWDSSHTALIKDAEGRISALHEEVESGVGDNKERATRVATRMAELVERQRELLEHRRPDLEDLARAVLIQESEAKIETIEQQLTRQIEKATVGFSSLEQTQEAVAALSTHEQTVAALRDHEKVLSSKHNESLLLLAKLSTEKLDAARRVHEADAALRKAEESLSAGLCPTCHQTITPEHRELCLEPLRDIRSERAKRQQENEEELIKAQKISDATESELGQMTQSLQQWDGVLNQLRHAEHELNRVTVLQQELAHVKATAAPEELVHERVDNELKRRLADYRAKQQGRVNRVTLAANARLADLRGGLSHAAEQLKGLKQQKNPHLDAYQKAIAQVSSTSVEREAAEVACGRSRAKAAIYNYWNAGFSKQGIQSLLMEEIAVLFNNNRGNIFPLLTQGVYDVQFSTLSTTRKGEQREKTDFFIYEHGEQVPYATLSGGQRRRVDIGIMLVLTQAVAKWMGSPGVLGLLILDEVFGFLDASGAEGLVAALDQISEQVPTVYVMTHDTALQSLMPNTVHVMQGADGTSSVVR